MTAVDLTGNRGVYVGSAPKTAHKQVAFGDFTGYSVVELFSVPAGTVVLDIIGDITTGFTGSCVGLVGDGDDPNRFFDSWAMDGVAGQSMKQDGAASSGGYQYTAADTIDITMSGATAAAGVVDIYLVFLPGEDFALD